MNMIVNLLEVAKWQKIKATKVEIEDTSALILLHFRAVGAVTVMNVY